MQIAEFLKRQILITHIYGIPVKIDNRWFVVLILMSWLTASNIPPSIVSDYLAKFVLGLITTLVFFFSIFLHELGHSLIAQREDVEVREIVLHPFGGLARFKRPPDNPKAEFRIAIAGPATSFLIAVFFLLVWFASSGMELRIITPLAFLLFFWNLLLAVFNLFPGYPLDGGRVLRAILWKRGNDLNEATILTGKAGQLIGIGLIAIGFIVALFRGDFFTGLWTIIVGFFLFDSAAGIIRETKDLGVTLVNEVMSPPFTLSPTDNLLHFVDNILPLRRQTSFPVARDRQFFGILTLEDIKPIEKSDWHKITIQEIMRPITPDYFVESETLLSEAREIMRQNGVGSVGVIDSEGNLVGFLQKGKIRRKIK